MGVDAIVGIMAGCLPNVHPRVTSRGQVPRLRRDSLQRDVALAVLGVVAACATCLGVAKAECVDYRDYLHAVGSVGGTGSYRYGIAVSGTHAYVANQSVGLQVISITNPQSPQIVASVATRGMAVTVAVGGTRVYVAGSIYPSGGFLQVIDVTTPESPQVMGSLDTPNVVGCLTVLGAYVYAAENATPSSAGTLRVVDISNPRSLRIVGGVALGDVQGVAVSGTHAYIAEGSLYRVQVVDIANPVSPRIVGAVTTAGPANGVAISGSHAYVTSDYTGLQVVDIANPTLPRVVGRMETGGSSSAVAVSGNRAYVADADGLQAIDITNPSDLRIVGSVDASWATGVVISGSYAYVSNGGSLQIVDISTPQSPSIVGGVETLQGAYCVSASGDHAYVVDGRGNLQVIDITSPVEPGIVGSAHLAGGGWKIAVSGDYVYVASVDSLQVIDIANPRQPRIVSTANVPGGCRNLALSGAAAYVATGGGLRVIDVTNPLHPQIVGTVATGRAAAVAVSGIYAYVAGESLQVVDISTPQSPRIVGQVAPSRFGGFGASEVVISGAFAYIAGDGPGLQVVDISTPASPRIVGTGLTRNLVIGVTMSDGYAYLAESYVGRSRVHVLDITDPQSPQSVGVVGMFGPPMGVVVSGDHVYVADRWFGLQVLPAQCDREFHVASAMPQSGSGGIPTTTNISVIFSKAIVQSTVNSASWNVTGTRSGVNHGQVVTSETFVSYLPNPRFEVGDVVTCSLSTAIQSMGGEHLAALFVWQFTVDRDGATYPTILGLSPGDGASEVAQQVAVGVRFSESIRAATLNDTTWTMFGSASRTIRGQIQWAAPDSATFRPLSPLRYAEVVTATLSGTISDLSGHSLDGNGDGQGGDGLSWQFTVANPPAIGVLARDQIPAGRYVMASLPVRPGRGSRLSTILSDLGPPGVNRWRGFGVANSEYVNDPIIEPGQAFIVATKLPVRPTFRGYPLFDSIAVALTTGWNLVGCAGCGAAAYPWPECTVISGDSELPLRDQTSVTPAVVWYVDDTGDLRNDGLWEELSGDRLFSPPPARTNPWGAYLVDARVPCTLVFRQHAGVQAAESGSRPGAAAGGVGTGDWSIRLYAEADGTRDGWVEVGVQHDAAAGRGDLDMRKPPPFGDGVKLSVSRDDGNGGPPDAHLTDFRGQREACYTWDLTLGYVGSRGHADTARLVWQGLSGVPAEWNVYLVTGDNSAVDMRTTSGYGLLLPAGETRRLSVRVSKERWQGEIVETGRSSIVALGPSPAVGDVNMELRVGHTGPVDLTVFDVQGRVVDRLLQETREPGQYALTWSPARSGVVSGVYFVKLRTAAGEDTRRVVLIRG